LSVTNPKAAAALLDPAALSQTIAAIHAGVFDRAFPEFRTRTLEVIRPDIPFDVAVWGSGVFSTKTMLTTSPVGLDTEAVLEYASQWQGPDLLRDATAASPGRALRYEDIMPVEDFRASRFYMEYLKPRSIEHLMGIVHRDEVTDLAEVIFLLRADASPAFSDADCRLLELLTPHMCAAWRHRQISHHNEEARRTDEPGLHSIEGFAVADAERLAYAVGDSFCLALRAVSSDWRGPYLPAFLQPLLDGGAVSLELGDFRFTARPSSGFNLLAVARAASAGGLTPAETRVARLFSEGWTHRQIAAHFGSSQSTVRHQIAAAYRKLGIHSKAELTRYVLRART
jgi:DNA-binding CsgD family transcriptional regulator